VIWASPARRTILRAFPTRKELLCSPTRLSKDEVKASLERDPRIPRSVEIAVSDDRGMVTLRGTVERFSQRRAAAEDAATIDGVYEVDNNLKVKVLDNDSREEHEIRGAAAADLGHRRPFGLSRRRGRERSGQLEGQGRISVPE
jgi:BON domain